MSITIRLEGPFLASVAKGIDPVTRYRLKSIRGAVTVWGSAGQYRPGDLLTEDQAKGLALDYEVNTEAYKDQLPPLEPRTTP